MATTGHTYNSSCLLHTESNTFTRRASEASVDPPAMKAHYFYCSVLPIDDPLSPVPPPPSGTPIKQKLPPRPFSIHDNAALEQAWLNLQDPARDHGPRLQSSQALADVGTNTTTTFAAPSSFDDVLKTYKKAVAEVELGVSRGKVTSSTQASRNNSESKSKAAAFSVDSTTIRDQNADYGPRGQSQERHKNDLTIAGRSERSLSADRSGQGVRSHTLSTVGKDAAEDGLGVQSLAQETAAPVDSRDRTSAQQNGQILQPDLTLSDNVDNIPFDEAMPVGSAEIGNDEFEGNSHKRGRKPFRDGSRKEKQRSNAGDDSKGKDEPELRDGSSPYRRLSVHTQKVHDAKQKSHEKKFGSIPAGHDTTGTPFLRIASRLRGSRSWSRKRSQTRKTFENSQNDGVGLDVEQDIDSTAIPAESLAGPREGRRRSGQDKGEGHLTGEPTKPPTIQVTVGVSRLHVVELSNLKMGPIYWDPVHDVSSVARGTWFYKETMWPVEADVANQIEEGYEYIKPWTLTYVDELNSCQEIGPEAEFKLVNRLWPAEEPPDTGPKSAADRTRKELLSTAAEHLDYQNQDRKNAVVMAGSAVNRAAGVLDGYDDPVRLFSKCSMVYINARDAQILRPNQLPSVARGRKPLAAMRKGRPVGIPVVRGFDFKAWEKLYSPPKVNESRNTQTRYQSTQMVRSMTNKSRQDPPCEACQSANASPKPTDLVLVIHGIGQKLSERVESFNFTHSINAFRRSVNMELETAAIQPWLRQGLGSIMVLPINWRSKIELEDGTPTPDPSHQAAKDSYKNEFTLQDITERSIPAVRNLISDVLLDIPYYLSHHKPKMIEAVIKEANRVYRLWCLNNPGFYETGRVHILAHSLGSVMTLDILSKQPTRLPKQMEFDPSEARGDIFEFDTTDVFFAGSPAGLFLYINRAPLIPRRGREKPDADGEDIRPGVTGEAGTYGCLAVDNLYNVIHYIDPIAYRLNAAVDVNYAASLQAAELPSTAGTWAKYFGFRSTPAIPAAPTKALTGLDNFPTRPSIQAMPSTVELETHNFTREEIAEKRMYLLNDNGQIDYTLRSGGGPLEIQYLNMLSAHSSYWTTPEFVRFLVVEVGRKPGKGGTVAAMKAVKKVRNKK